MMSFLVQSGNDWFLHQIVSAIVHGAVYGTIYHLFKNRSLSAAMLCCVLLIGAAWLLYKFFKR